MIIRPYLPEDETDVIKLWQRCNLVRPWNDPGSDIARKLKMNPELFLVGIIDNAVMATAMGGYEGHRGWVNYLAVDPAYQRKGFGRLIIEEIEKTPVRTGMPQNQPAGTHRITPGLWSFTTKSGIKKIT